MIGLNKYARLPACLHACLPVRPSVCLSARPSARPSVRPSVCMSVRPSVRLSVRLTDLVVRLFQTALDYMVKQDAKMILSCTYLAKYVQDNPLPEYTQRVLGDS